MTVEEMTAEVLDLHAKIGAPIDRHNPEVIADTLVELVGWLARSGVLEADAKQLLTQAEGEQSERLAPLDLPHNKLKSRIQTEVVKEQKLFDLAHRLVSTCIEAINVYRSVLSYTKESMRF